VEERIARIIQKEKVLYVKCLQADLRLWTQPGLLMRPPAPPGLADVLYGSRELREELQGSKRRPNERDFEIGEDGKFRVGLNFRPLNPSKWKR
jgi:hypothetical protein